MENDEYKEDVDDLSSNKNYRKEGKCKDGEIDLDVHVPDEFSFSEVSAHSESFLSNPTFDDFLFIFRFLQEGIVYPDAYGVFEENKIIQPFLFIAATLSVGNQPFENAWFSEEDNLCSFYTIIFQFIQNSTNLKLSFVESNGFCVIFQTISVFESPKCREILFSILTYVLSSFVTEGFIESHSIEQDVSKSFDEGTQYASIMQQIAKRLCPSFEGFASMHDIREIIENSTETKELLYISHYLCSIEDVLEDGGMRDFIFSLMWVILSKSLGEAFINSKETPKLMKEIFDFFNEVVRIDFTKYLHSMTEFFSLVSGQWDNLTPDVTFMVIDFYLNLYKMQSQEFRLVPLISDFIPFTLFVNVLGNRVENEKKIIESKSKEEKEAAQTQLASLPVIFNDTINLLTELIPLLSGDSLLFDRFISSNIIDVMIELLNYGSFKEKTDCISVINLFIKNAPASFLRCFVSNYCSAESNFVDNLIDLNDESTPKVVENLLSILSQLIVFVSDEDEEMKEKLQKSIDEIEDNIEESE